MPTQEETQTLRLLQEALDIHNAYAVTDRSTRPTYPAYVEARKGNRRRIRQLISDIRWMREGKVGLAPLLPE
jgi:hypothetical protein